MGRSEPSQEYITANKRELCEPRGVQGAGDVIGIYHSLKPMFHLHKHDSTQQIQAEYLHKAYIGVSHHSQKTENQTAASSFFFCVDLSQQVLVCWPRFSGETSRSLYRFSHAKRSGASAPEIPPTLCRNQREVAGLENWATTLIHEAWAGGLVWLTPPRLKALWSPSSPPAEPGVI